jgi:hypothetical protein
MSYLPPCTEYGVTKPARGTDGFGWEAVSAISDRLVTRLSEYDLTVSSTVAGTALCPAWRSRAVKNRPISEPTNGMMNFSRWILSAASACTPIQKHPPMHIGMIMNNTRRNLYRNSKVPILMVVNRFSIALTPRSALRMPL